ncbi:arsenic resistance protein [Brevibacterium yomogidense]|nr:bile acid:sodium symporter [Brevibacterium yomogidense]
MVVAAAVGLTVPPVAAPAEAAITPVLGLLLYATFLGVPFGSLTAALREGRFLATVLVVNFAVVPGIVLVLSRIVAHDEALLVGVLFVLLTPCIDYVLAFTRLAGGAHARLLAMTPLLMLVQIALLPAYLVLFVGSEVVGAVEFAPFAEAFVLLIVIPLLAAALTQAVAARSEAGLRWEQGVAGAMVPLMMLTLAVVVASQIAGVGARVGSLLLAVPVYVLFAVVMVPIGIIAGRVARLDVPGTRAVVFSAATRNSLVVLPLVLALPARYDLAPLVVVTQTLVELIAMVVFVRLVPRLVRA